MRIGNQVSYSPLGQTKNAVVNSQNTNRSFADLTRLVSQSETPTNIHVFMPNENTIFSGGQANGMSIRVDYAAESTDENPIAHVVGVDNKTGNRFEQTIEINKVDPKNATYIEFRALEGHLNGGKGAALGSLTGMLNHTVYGEVLTPGINDRMNYIAWMMKQAATYSNSPISEHKTTGREYYAELDMWSVYLEAKEI